VIVGAMTPPRTGPVLFVRLKNTLAARSAVPTRIHAEGG
jgi:hypothetical protein